MADELPANHEDFAEVALRVTKTPMAEGDAVPPATKKETATTPKKEEPAPKKDANTRELPSELFGKVPEPKKDEPEPTRKSELEDIEQPDFKDPKRKGQWDALHGKADKFEKQAWAAEVKAAELEKKIADADERGKDTETLQAKLVEAERKYAESMELVRKVNVELDPAFNEKFVKGRAILVKDIATTVSDAGGDADSITIALNLSGRERTKAIAAAIQDLPVFTQGIVGRQIENLSSLDTEAATHRSTPEQYLKQREHDEQQRTTREQQEMAQRNNLAFDSALKRASGLEVLNEVKGLDWWNDQRKQILDNSRKFYESPPSQEAIAQRCLEGEVMPIYRQLFLDVRKEGQQKDVKIAELEGELKKIHSKSPQLGGRGSSTADRANMTFAEIGMGVMNGSIPVNGSGKE